MQQSSHDDSTIGTDAQSLVQQRVAGRGALFGPESRSCSNGEWGCCRSSRQPSLSLDTTPAKGPSWRGRITMRDGAFEPTEEEE